MSSDEQLGQLLSLLESSYTCEDNEKIKKINEEIDNLSKNLENYLSLLLKGLSLTSFNNKEISLNLHKSLSINLKNILSRKNLEIKDNQLSSLIEIIFKLFFTPNSNPNLLNESILLIFEEIIHKIISLTQKLNLEKIFNFLYQAISQEPKQSIIFINRAKIVITFIRVIFRSQKMEENNSLNLIKDYYIPIIDTIFKNVPNYIDPSKNIFNKDYFNLLDILIDDMYINFKNLKNNFKDFNRFNEIMLIIFDKYSLLIFELIKIQIPFDEESQKMFDKQNPLIIFNSSEEKYKEANNMKSKCIQFFVFVTEQFSQRNKENILDSFSVIKNEKLIEINAELIKLIISCFQDILNNEQKYQLIINPKEGLLKPLSCYNTLLFNMVLVFLRCLVREPIKTEFSSHIKYFTLNIIFPLIISPDSEKDFLESDSESYQIYINDILYDYKFRCFRTALCYFIKKSYDNYPEIKSFLMTYVMNMLNYIFNIQNNNLSTNGEYFNNLNNYFNVENKSLINGFDDAIKIDFCFLILLILKDSIAQNNIMKINIFSFLIENQDKIHQINSTLILYKICLFYKEYSTYFFQFLQKENEISIKKSIIEKMINFLLDLILSNQKYYDRKEALITEASDTIINIFKFAANATDCNLYIKEILEEKLIFSFNHFVRFTDVFDNSSLNTLVSDIIELVHIEERKCVLNCLENFTKKFIIISNTNYNYINKDDELKNKILFISQYFILVRHYLKGENKFNTNDKNEIIQFNKIISPVIGYISQPKNYSFYEDIVSLGENYINALNSINEIGIQILNNLYPIIQMDKTLSGNYYSFITTFLSHIDKTQSHKPFIDKVIDIIKLSLKFTEDDVYEEILYSFLLILQILGFENQIDSEDLKYIIGENLKWFFSLFVFIDEQIIKKIILLSEESVLDRIEQIIVSNLSLCFIYYPNIILNLLKEEIQNIISEECNIKNLSDFIISLYTCIFNQKSHVYYSNLGKCDALCLCAILRNSEIFNHIFDDMSKKIDFLKLVINFFKKHKDESISTKSKLTEEEINCDFINEEGDKSDNECDFNIDFENIGEEFDNNFYETANKCLKMHNIINNSDEFKIFSETFYFIKNNDPVLFNSLLADFDKDKQKIVKDLLFVRNVKVEYNGKKYEIPRRTLKIKRNVY